MSLVSVIIPSYNRAYCIGRAINSVLTQTHKFYEIIVVDNCSSDGTQSLVQQYNDSRIRLLSASNDGVIAKSRNIGIRAASGEHIAFLDSDDWWSDTKLEVSVNYLKNGSDIVYHDLNAYCAATAEIIGIQKTRQLSSAQHVDLLVNGNAINNSSVVVKKSVLEAVGFISEEKAIVSAEDYDLWLKIAARRFSFRRIPETLGFYQVNGDGIASKKKDDDIDGLEQLMNVLIKHLTIESNQLSLASRKSIARNISRIRYAIAVWQMRNGQINKARRNFRKNIMSSQEIIKSVFRSAETYFK